MSIEAALIDQKCKEYKEYINDHKLNVERAWNDMKNNKNAIDLISQYIPNINIDMTFNLIDDLVKHHDESKYSPEEFDAYRKSFYPISKEEEESAKAELDKAWNHHYMNNMHHWNYWHLSGNVDRMPFHFVVEMICDWKAMEYGGKGPMNTWYAENKDKIYLGEKQREFAEALMKTFDE